MDLTGIVDPSAGSFMIKCGSVKGHSKIAAFDLDHTLIAPKSGRKFPKDTDDWMLLEGVKKKLNELYTNDYKIVVFTNQGSSSFILTEFIKKIEAIAESVGVPMHVFGSNGHGFC